jgi:hypothetical protein
MLVALTVRKVKPGKADDLVAAMDPGDREVPEGWKRFYALRSLSDPDEIITFGFFDGTIEQLREGQSQQEGYQEMRAQTDPLVESIGADGIYEVFVEEQMG